MRGKQKISRRWVAWAPPRGQLQAWGQPRGACSALAELVVFLFVASALASPAREVGRVFLVLNRPSGEWLTTTPRKRGCSLSGSEHPRF
jgi:hypothetical protein